MNGRKRLGALCLVVVMMLPFAQTAMGEDFPYVAYATDSVRLRSKPSSSGDILAVIRQGDAVLITGSDGNYKIVEYEGRKGYVISAFLSQTPNQATSENEAAPEIAANYQLLSNGSSGPRVKALQQALEELGYYTLAIDSKYGAGTAKAVSSFQQNNALTQTGSADAATQHLLFEGMPKNSRGVQTDVKTLPPIPGYTIRPGDRGDAVAEVQQGLTALKYYTGAIDGVYGSGSQSAVKALQKDSRLKQDGIIGAKTFAALAAALQAAQSSGASQPASVSETPAPASKPNTYVEPPLPEAVYPYSTTAAASVNLRKRASLSSTRLLTIPEGATVEVLEDTGSFLKINYRKYTGYVAKEFINIPEQYLDGKVLEINQDARINYQTLAPGAEGRAVRALQHALAEHGYYTGGIDGKFGSSTTAAVKALQKKNGLRETGIVLPELQQLIFEKRVRNSKNKLVYSKTLPPLDGLVMQQGDYGDAVYELNQMLLESGHYDSTVGYEFTKATTNAVRAFQKDHKIKVTGKADAFTLLALRTAIKAQGKTDTQPATTSEPLTQDNVIIIREGTSGLAVTRLQQRLVELKYYNITPDGVFNSDDVVALRHFQRVNNLPVTGVADLATQQTLYTGFAIGADALVNQPVVNPLPSGSLKIGASGADVRAMQSRLVTLNYLTGSVDSIFGTQTAAAVTAFQRANGLKQDGIAGTQTLGVLYSVNAVANKPVSTPSPEKAPAAAEETLQVGSTGSAVISLQNRLIELKYLTGAADGIYGPRTFLAVKEFQQKNSLKADGIAGRLTKAKLASSSAVSNHLPASQSAASALPSTPSASTFKAPKASEVRYANWYTEIRPIASKLRNVTIYDFMSGKHYEFRFFSLGKHADGATLTAADSAVMNSVLGENNWTPRPVWVIFSDGRVYMASTHSHPHENDYIKDNGINGHLCVHFPRDMEEAALTGPYAVSHQNAILAGWDLTQNMARTQ